MSFAEWSVSCSLFQTVGAALQNVVAPQPNERKKQQQRFVLALFCKTSINARDYVHWLVWLQYLPFLWESDQNFPWDSSHLKPFPLGTVNRKHWTNYSTFQKIMTWDLCSVCSDQQAICLSCVVSKCWHQCVVARWMIGICDVFIKHTEHLS